MLLLFVVFSLPLFAMRECEYYYECDEQSESVPPEGDNQFERSLNSQNHEETESSSLSSEDATESDSLNEQPEELDLPEEEIEEPLNEDDKEDNDEDGHGFSIYS